MRSSIPLLVETAEPDATSFFEWLELEAALATRQAAKHVRNEDRYIFLGPGNRLAERMRAGYLFGVFDGCGGTAGGADAAQHVADAFKPLLGRFAEGRAPSREDVVSTIVMEANALVYRRQSEVERLENMAAAGTVAWLWEEPGDEEQLHGLIAHVGDTRAFLVREGQIHLLTRDHKAGHVLEHVYGMRPKDFTFDLRQFLLREGDLLLIGSDGLWKPHSVDLLEVVRRVAPESIVRTWCEQAWLNGSDDDQTAIAVRVG